MDYKYVVFSPYFGKLPDNFNLWLKSCLYNAEIKFIVFTDDNRQWDKPINVEIIKISFEDFKEKIQKKFLATPKDMVYSCFDLYPKSLDELLAETGLEIADLNQMILEMQLEGLITEISKN